MKFDSKIPVLIFLLASELFLLPHDARAQFTAGNIVVFRVGDGSLALSANTAPAFLDEYTRAGTSVQTVTIPTSGSGRLTVTGNSSTEGCVNRSVDGRFLTFTGYDAAVATASVSTGTPSTYNRVVGRIDALGNFDGTTRLTDAYNGSNIRSAITSSGTDIWTSGNGGSGQGSSAGVRYTTLGSTTSTQLNSSPTNMRWVNIFNGQLYVSSSTQTYLGISTIGTGTPTTTSQTMTALSGMPTSGTHSAYGFSISPDGNTLYMGDDGAVGSGGGIQKWTFSSSTLTWSQVYILLNNGTTTTGVRGLTVDWSGTNPVIYAITSASTSVLIKVIDTGSGSTATTLATAGTNEAFRGVAFAPYSTVTFADGTTYTGPDGTPNTDDNPIGQFHLTSNLTGSKLNSVTVNLTGTYTGITGLKLYASSSAAFSVGGSTLLASTTPGSPAAFAISGGDSIPTSGEYYYVATDLDNSASGKVSVSISDQTKLSFTTEAVCNAFSNALLHQPPDVPLPVTLKGITAKVDAGKIYLNISTATEIDVAGFNISRSLSNDGPFDLISSYVSNSALKASGSTTSGGTYSFIDSKVSAGQTYYYKVESVTKSGASQQVGEILKVQVQLPKAYAVYQNYPNPFNPTTSIRFDLKADATVTVEFYNLLGMKIKSLNNGTMSAGTHEVPVDMSKMPSGVYYYRFTAIDNTGNAFVQTQRMVLVK